MLWRVRGRAPHTPPGADRDKPRLWAHLLSKERTLGYIATAGDGLRTHLRDLACDLDSQTLASHAYQSCAYGTLGEGATP